MKSVHKISKAKFMVTTIDVPNSELQLDFNPIIEQFNLQGKFYLIHWQARPKGHREYLFTLQLTIAIALPIRYQLAMVAWRVYSLTTGRLLLFPVR